MSETEKAIINWLANGRTGLSSETIAFCMLGQRFNRAMMPADPSDFGRCAGLMVAVPLLKLMWAPIYRKMYPEFAAFPEHWAEIYLSMEKEVGIDWRKGKKAPKTYKLMQRLLHEAPS